MRRIIYFAVEGMLDRVIQNVGAGLCACSHEGQPQGVAPTRFRIKHGMTEKGKT